MTHPSLLSIDEFFYELPDEKIARFPLTERDAAKLLVWKNGQASTDQYRNIARHLPEGALLVFNNSRVIPARLFFTKPTGAVIEIFLLEPADIAEGLQPAMEATGTVSWKCLVGGAGKWKHGQILEKVVESGDMDLVVRATIRGKSPDGFLIEFSWIPGDLSFASLLHIMGEMPIPPYLKREAGGMDDERYQTIYARPEGSVAAPTAGLHFTDAVFSSLAAKHIQVAFTTLHVGAGTFMPVKSDRMEGHVMHHEFIEITRAFLDELMAATGKTFAVGTTSLRTLESLYWMGVKCCHQPDISGEALEMKQWEVYDHLLEKEVTVMASLGALKGWMEAKALQTLVIRTQILIAPPYKPKMIRGLVTNFHQPNSTLLLLVAALIGDDWHTVYSYAVENNYRFLSYGDGSLLFVE